jgi:hypothetical protein
METIKKLFTDLILHWVHTTRIELRTVGLSARQTRETRAQTTATLSARVGNYIRHFDPVCT